MSIDIAKLDTFTLAYLEAALWSSTDNSTPQGGDYLDTKYGFGDIASEALSKAVQDCADFQVKFSELLQKFPGRGQWSGDECAGHDFWLTRNGHGAGFWDRGLGELGTKLTNAAHSYGERDLYVGDDGKIYGF